MTTRSTPVKPGAVPRRLLAAGLALAAALLQGCATTNNPRDPLEPLNRRIFGFNQAVDDAVLKPVAKGYDAITPQPVQTGVTNFINNIKDVWSAINLVLQGRPGDAAQEVLRVGLNSTLGMAGFVDVATPMQLERHNEDFGQTLGVWGAPPGAYLVLPILGPSTARDVIGLPGDLYFSASNLFGEPRDANAVRLWSGVHQRARALGATNLLGDVALDQYAFIRDAYLQRRQTLIYNGETPDDDEVGGYDDDADDVEEGANAPAAAPTSSSSAAPQAGGGAALTWRSPLRLPESLDGQLPLADGALPAWFTASLEEAAAGPAGSPSMASAGPAASSSNVAEVSEKHGREAFGPTQEEQAGLRNVEAAR